VRDASSLVASQSKEALDSVRKIAIGQTLVPTHMSRERFGDKSAYAAAAAAGTGTGAVAALDMRSPLDDAAAASSEGEPGLAPLLCGVPAHAHVFPRMWSSGHTHCTSSSSVFTCGSLGSACPSDSLHWDV